MEFSIKQIAQLVGGDIVGNSDLLINNFAKIEEGVAGCISFLANLKYENYLYTTLSSAIIVSKDFVPKSTIPNTLILVEDPYLALSIIMAEYQKNNSEIKKGIEANVYVDNNAKVSAEAYISAFTYISSFAKIEDFCQIYPQVFIGKNVNVGKNTIIYAGVKIYDDCKIGENCIIHSGAIIGADGFGFAPNSDGVYNDIPQLGNVIIEDNVSIGANSTIDRATMGSTFIRKGVKIDNQVQIGHNVEIGENTIIAAQTAVAGSSKIGKNCLIAGQVGIGGHIKIADGTKIGAQSGLSKSITEPNGSFSGRPLLPIKDHLKLLVNLRRMNQNPK
jgi:UDP-3-O-[3-hydroxymyristoyl] glucosamine N-acyltransferase